MSSRPSPAPEVTLRPPLVSRAVGGFGASIGGGVALGAAAWLSDQLGLAVLAARAGQHGRHLAGGRVRARWTRADHPDRSAARPDRPPQRSRRVLPALRRAGLGVPGDRRDACRDGVGSRGADRWTGARRSRRRVAVRDGLAASHRRRAAGRVAGRGRASASAGHDSCTSTSWRRTPRSCCSSRRSRSGWRCRSCSSGAGSVPEATSPRSCLASSPVGHRPGHDVDRGTADRF